MTSPAKMKARALSPVEPMTTRDNTRSTDARHAVFAASIVVICAWGLAAWLASRSTLFDRDEPRFARAAIEMAASGNWLYPTFRGELRPDKPILVYWPMALALRVLGHTAFATRFVSPLALAAACAITFRAASRLFDRRVGVSAAALLAVSPLALAEGTLATTDALLLAFTSAATWLGLRTVLEGARPARTVGLAIALALALVTKGPVGLVVPLLSIATAAALARRVSSVASGALTAVTGAAVAGLALSLVWAIPANAATGGEFVRQGLGHHVLGRSTSAFEGHGGSFLLSLPFYVPVVFVGALPCAPFVLGAFAWLALEAPARTRAALFGWTTPCLLLMTLVATKLAHYVLPAWPGVCIACAAFAERAAEGPLDARVERWGRAGRWVSAAATVALAAAAIAAPSTLDLRGSPAPFFALALVMACAAATSFVLVARGRWRAALCASIAQALVSWLVVGLWILPAIEREKLAPKLAAALNAQPSTLSVATFRYREPSLDFDLSDRIVRQLDGEDAVRAWLDGPGPALLVLPERDAAHLLRPDRIVDRVVVEGLNLSTGRRTTLVVARRAGT